MTIYKEIDLSEQLKKNQLEMLARLNKVESVPDEENPELTPEVLSHLKKVTPRTVDCKAVICVRA